MSTSVLSTPPIPTPFPTNVEYGTKLLFNSRRSPFLCIHGAVASSQPHASQIGLSILQQGGSCVDACIGMAAALNVTEPCSTGLGGDCFAIYYDSQSKKVLGLNGSGRSPAALNVNTLPSSARDGNHLEARSVHCVTIPGAAAGWIDASNKWGKLPLSRVLEPAIKLAEEGVPIEPIAAHMWKNGAATLKRHKGGHQLLNAKGEAPTAGEVFRNPNLASTFRVLATEGKDGFYRGRIADAIIALLQSEGGLHTHEDLSSHRTTFPDPIKVNYKGIDVWEIPPSGQGITALLGLNFVSQLTPALSTHPLHSADHLHLLIDVMRLAFADSRHYVADADLVHVPVEALLSESYAKRRAALLNRQKATLDLLHGSPDSSSDTVSFCAVDNWGNACSFINSNYMGFGTGYVPEGCGFSLQNRGGGFTLDPKKPNVLAGGKRPYHTIIPGMATIHETGELFGPFSVMGGFMQPQGHVQVITNMIDYGLEPQLALDAARFCIVGGESGGHVYLEDGITEDVKDELSSRGHVVKIARGWEREMFGRGQIIRKAANGVLWCGSDGRGGGCAAGY